MVLVLAPELLGAYDVETPVRLRCGALHRNFPGAFRKGDEGHTGEGRQAFLATRDDDIDPPFILLQRYRAQRTHRVHHTQRAMVGHEGDDLFQVAGVDTRRCLALNHRDNVVAGLVQRLCHHRRRHGTTVGVVQHGDVGTHTLGHLGEAATEQTVAQHQDAASWPQQVGDGHLHGCRGRSGHAVDPLIHRLEHVAGHLADVAHDHRHRFAYMVDDEAARVGHLGRHGHGAGGHQQQRLCGQDLVERWGVWTLDIAVDGCHASPFLFSLTISSYTCIGR